MSHYRDYIDDVVKSGSTKAFYHIVKEFENQVFTYCLRFVKNREVAEEAAQDVFLRCYRNIHSLRDYDKFPQWLFKIAYSVAIDYVRKVSVRMTDLEENVIAMTTDQDIQEEWSPDLESALRMLDPKDLSLIVLYYQEDMSVKEICEVTDLSPSNVKVRLFRARSELRNYLDLRGKYSKHAQNIKNKL